MKRTICLLLISIMIITQTGCIYSDKGSDYPISLEEFMLDTVCSISIYGMRDADGNDADSEMTEDSAVSAADDAFALCRELEDRLSRTRDGSEISRLNAANGGWTEVSEDTLELIRKGIGYSELSGGAFDITVGGLTGLWNFHAPEGQESLPDKDDLAEAARHVGFSDIEIDGRRVRLRDSDAEIDLGGIAKGYIGDRMTEVLLSAGVTSAIINLGGNVICIGGKSADEDFVIGVEMPFSDRTEIVGKINARDKTLVTSGIYERKFEKDGKIYHHILDAGTGWPVETDLDAVTLVADTGHSADIDALSTICLIKGSGDGIGLIEETDGIEGVFVLRDGSILETSGIRLEKP